MNASKGFLLATAGSVAAATGAQAADLPMKAAPMPYAVAPVANWTGFYVGGHLGANWQMVSSTYSDPQGASGQGFGTAKSYGAGFIGGGQIGYNWQFGSTVWGIEASISGLTGKATSTQVSHEGPKGNTIESKISWLATVRGRAGWLIDPSTLVYGTGGVAFGHVKNANDQNGIGNTNPDTFKSVSKTKTGWVAGGGIEHMFGRNWTIGVEVLYVDLGKTTGTTISGTPPKSTTFRNTAAIGQLKLNYKF